MKNRAAEDTATPETQVLTAEATEAQPTPAPLERVLVKSDQANYQKAKAAFGPSLPLVQEALDAFLALNVGPITLKELFNFASNPNASLEKEVRNRVYEGNPTLKAFPISKEALLPGVELPAGFPRAKEALADIKQAYGDPAWAHTYNPFSCTRFYLVDENNQVSFNWPKIEQELESAFNQYLTEPDEIALYHKLQAAYEVLSEAQALVRDRSRGSKQIMTQRSIYGVIGVGSEDKVFFNPALLKNIFQYSRY